MAWTEVDSAVTSPAEAGYTASQMIAKVALNCSNLPTQHPHYSSLLSYINEAKDEFMTLMLEPRGKKLLDLMQRLRNWRWYDVTVNAQNYLPLPDTLLDLEAVSYTQSQAAYAPSSVREYPSFPEQDPVLFGLFTKTQTGWPVKWRRAGARVELWPTPSSTPTDYRTMLVLRGTRKEDDLLADNTNKWKMDMKLQNFVGELATAIAMEKMQWEEAQARRTSFEQRMEKYLSIATEERTRSVIRSQIAGTPR